MESKLFIKEDAKFSHGLELQEYQAIDLYDVLQFHFKDLLERDPVDHIEQGFRKLVGNVEAYISMGMPGTFPIVMPEGTEQEYIRRLAFMTAAYAADLANLAITHDLIPAEREVPEHAMVWEAFARVYEFGSGVDPREFSNPIESNETNSLQQKLLRMDTMASEFGRLATNGFTSDDTV